MNKKRLLICFIFSIFIMMAHGARAEIDCDEFDNVMGKALDGDAQSQYEVGKAYYFNLCGITNYEESIYWFQRSADLGNPNAYYSLGLSYETGLAVKKNRFLAEYYLKKAADSDHKYASAELVNFYLKNSENCDGLDKASYYYSKIKNSNAISIVDKDLYENISTLCQK